MVQINFHFNSSYQIRIGDSIHSLDVHPRSTLILDVIQSQIHKNYTKGPAYFDVAVLTTNKIIFSEFISPVCLPDSASEDIDKYKNDYVDLIGWGQKNKNGEISKSLQRVSLKVYPSR